MAACEADSSFQLACVKALATGEQSALTDQNVRDVIRIMRAQLQDRPLIVELLGLVTTALANSSIRALFIDRGVLQVVARAVCTYEWSSSESAGANARSIICDVAHKLDVPRTLSTLEAHFHGSEGLSANTPAISTDALEACCCVAGALASVKSFLIPLIEGDAIRHLVGMLRAAKRDLVATGQDSFVRIVTTCFYALSRIVGAPVVTLLSSDHAEHPGVDGRSIQDRLTASEAYDAIVGCLEEALRFDTCPSLLVDRGCRLLHSVLLFPMAQPVEAANRWISVAFSILKDDLTERRTRELVFGTSLLALKHGDRWLETKGRQFDLLKVILIGFETSIRSERCFALSETECMGAIGVFDAIVMASGALPDHLVSRCLGVLGKLMQMFVLSSCRAVFDNLKRFDDTLALIVSPSYLRGLAGRLEKSLTKIENLDSDAIQPHIDDFKALEALLLSSQAKKLLTDMSYHRFFARIADLVDNFEDYTRAMGSDAASFLELGCLASRYLPVSRREHVINAALCRFAENTEWHSMRWVPAATDRESNEMELIVEFVLLRIVSGYSVLETALLIELLKSLSFLLRCGECRKILLTSSHSKELQDVLWELVQDCLAYSAAESKDYDRAGAVLGVMSTLLATYPPELFSIEPKGNDPEQSVQLCLRALGSAFSETNAGFSQSVATQELLLSTGTILQHCIHLGAEYARTIVQHRATRLIIEKCSGAAVGETGCQFWCLAMLQAMIQSHGLLYAEMFLKLASNPTIFLLSVVDIVVEEGDLLQWRHFVDCLDIAQDSARANDLEPTFSEQFTKLEQQSKRLVSGQTTAINASRAQKHILDAIAQLGLGYGQLSTTAGDTKATEPCLSEISLSGAAFYDLFCAAPSFEVCDYSGIVGFHLKIARVVAERADNERHVVEEAITTLRPLLNPICISNQALAAYLDLASTVYLSPSVRAAAWSFIDASTNVLTKVTRRLATGAIRAKCLEKSILNCFLSLQAVYAARWESGEVDSALQLLGIFSPDLWAQSSLLASILALPQGLMYLFELARAAPSDHVYGSVLMFAFRQDLDLHYQSQRVGELELAAILSVIRRHLAGKVGDTSHRKWGGATGCDILRCALETMKKFVRVKHYAVLCAKLDAVDVMYKVLCAPSQHEESVYLGLEICCYLAGHGADLTNENVLTTLKLLFANVDTQVGPARSRLGFLVLELLLAMEVHASNMSTIQQCRTQIVPLAARSDEEADMLTQQLYIYRQKLSPRSKRKSSNSSHPPLRDDEIRNIIISNCRSVVQCPTRDGASSYIDLKTSAKSDLEPLTYTRLRKAIAQLSFVLDDPDMAMNESYVFDLVPSLCEILVLHTITTPTICTVMRILSQIAFVNPSILVSHHRVDFRALLASCSLHQRSSLSIAKDVSYFCNSLVAEYRVTTGDELSTSLLALSFELLDTWKHDVEVVERCLSTVHGLIEAVNAQSSAFLACKDILAMFNAVVAPHVGDLSISWNWLRSVCAIVDKLGTLIRESAQAMIHITLGLLRMFISHNFMAEKALVVLSRAYKREKKLPLQHLIDADSIDLLVMCLKLHLNDDAITRSSLGLLSSMISNVDTSQQTASQLVESVAAAPILLVCRAQLENAGICRMGLEIVHQMVQSLEVGQEGPTPPQFSIGCMPPKQSELLFDLLDAETIPLLCDLLDNYSKQGSSLLLKALLTLLNDLTCAERGRESMEGLHGLSQLQHAINCLWEQRPDPLLIELTIDCLVNLACSDRTLGHEWKKLPVWLLELAEDIQPMDSAGMCVEKIIGILGRLVVNQEISKSVASNGAFTILRLLSRVGEDYSLECAIYGLLYMLCEDPANVPILLQFEVISITTERISCHIRNEDTLLNSLCFLDLFVLNIGESYLALQDDCVFEALELVVREYPETSATQVYRIASTLLEKVTALDYHSTRVKPVHNTNAPMLPLEQEKPDVERKFQALLLKGSFFRILWGPQQDKVENIEIKMASSGDYLLFRRLSATQLPRIERIFVSQLQVCPQRSVQQLPVALSPTKRIFTRAFQQESFTGDRVLHLKIRGEDALVKANSTRERVYWAQALQWLVSRRGVAASQAPSP